MPLQLDEYRAELINQLLFATSQQEVNRLVDDAAKIMDRNNVNSEAFHGFIDTVIKDLKRFNPMEKEAQQWSNIKVAKILFRRLKENVQTKII